MRGKRTTGKARREERKVRRERGKEVKEGRGYCYCEGRE